MNRVLVRKELRELLPWGVLSFVLGAFDVIAALLSQLDMRPLSQSYSMLGGVGAMLFWFIAFALGTGLATREQDDRTLAFLDGLPVSRSEVFFTKMLVALGLVMVAPLVRFALVVALHLLSRESLEQSMHAGLLLKIFAQQMLAVTTGLLLGAALGRLRSLTWLTFGALIVALLLATEHYPQAAMLDPAILLDVHFHNGRVQFDVPTIVTQSTLCVIAGWFAWRGFTRVHRARVLNLDLLTRPVVSAVVSVLTVAVIAFAIYLVAEQKAEDFSDDAALAAEAERDRPFFAPSPPGQMQTRYYRFSYPAAEASAARELAAGADEIFEQVHTMLGVAPGAVIQVDASGSAPNTHGTAHFGRIRMRLNEEARIVLAHETAHVVAQRIAGNERDWLWAAAPALNEGLATWVHSRFGSTEEQRAGRFALAAAHARRELIIEEFADPDVLARVRDESMQYPTGEALIAATVKLYGEEVIPRLLRGFADTQLRSDLRGITLWHSVYQIAGMDLGAVTDEFYRQVSTHLAEHSTEIAQLPRPRIRVVTNGEFYGVQIILDRALTDAQSLQVRFKPAPGSPLTQIEEVMASPEQPVWRSDRSIRSGVICAQAGVAVATSQVLYEPWVCLPTADASEWSGEDIPEDALEYESQDESE